MAIALVGVAAYVDGSAGSDASDGSDPLVGVVLVLLGGGVQALQYVFEEKVMSDDVYNASPILLIGMEGYLIREKFFFHTRRILGFWGLVMCTFIIYPIVANLPGTDHGVIEDPENTWYMIAHSSSIQVPASKQCTDSYDGEK